MGYNLTKNSVVRNLPQLRQLAKEKQTLRFPTPSPRRLAYKLREAVAAAGEIAEFNSLHDEIEPFYRFREETGAVIAQYYPDGKSGSAQSMGEPLLPDDSSPSSSRPTKKRMPGVIMLVDVIGTLLKFRDEAEILFPDARLTQDEIGRLHSMISEKSLGFSIIDHTHGGGSGITLTSLEVPEEITWSPETSHD